MSPRTCCLFAFIAALAIGGCAFSTPNDLFSDAPSYSNSSSAIEYVIHISVDGLRPDAVELWVDHLPAYRRLRLEGAYTENARTAPFYGNTLPNHASQLTGRIVVGNEGHGWVRNSDFDSTVTLHSNRGEYVSSVFDVTGGAGLKSLLFSSKSKFSVFHRSYEDNIDAYVYNKDTEKLTDRFVDSLRTGKYAYAFLHLRDPDTAGHRFGWRLWAWHPYGKAISKSDRLIGQVLAAIDADPGLRGKSAVIVTADHGGHGHAHGPKDRRDYTIPFYVWGAGIPQGNLYNFGGEARADPGIEQIDGLAEQQPIRNGDAANLALSLLKLDPIPGSTINADMTLLREHTDRLRATP